MAWHPPLLFCLAGLETPTAGTVTVLGKDLGRSPAGHVARLYRDRIGFGFQTYNLIPSLTARENGVCGRRVVGRVSGGVVPGGGLWRSLLTG